MSQLGSGIGTSYPSAIDSRQTYVNGSTPAPDSDTRIDAELVNDLLAAVVTIETILGANVQGTYASLAARLNQFVPGSAGQPGQISFANTTLVSIPGSTHNVGQAALLFQLYDAASPANAIEPGAMILDVDSLSYDITMEFAAPQSGLLALGVTSPLYVAQFSNATTVTVAGSVHGLGTADLLFQVYRSDPPKYEAMEPGSLSINTTSFDVTLAFVTPQTGFIVLTAGGPTYAVSFTSVSSLSIPGSVHGLGTRALLFQTYNAASPRAALGDPSVRVHPTTYDVQVTFATPTSGRFVLAPTQTLTGHDFDIRDGGLVNQSAVRLHSETGSLQLQAGSGQRIRLVDALGAAKVTLNTQSTCLGLGTANPTHQLELSANDAVKPVSSAWTVVSDAALKEDVRPFEEGLDALLQLRPVRYRPVGTQDEAIGLVAQDVQPVAPYLVRTYQERPGPPWRRGTPSPTYLAIDRHALDHLFINAFQALTTRLAALETLMTSLQAEVMLLREQMPPSPAPEEEPAP